MFGQDTREFVAVFAGGAVGTLLRAATAQLFPVAIGQWPWATFAVNVVGTFMLGYLTTRLLERLPVSSYRRPLLGTGVCGGLTTFSTMHIEVLHMMQHREHVLAVTYTIASVVSGLLALYLATTVVRRIRIGGS